MRAFLLVLLSAAALAPLAPPAQVRHALEKRARAEIPAKCHPAAELFDAVALADGRLIAVYTLPTPLDECSPSYRNAWIALTYGPDGWKLSESGQGHVEELGVAPDGSAWLRAAWSIEGTYPILVRSADGTHWSDVELPKPKGPEVTASTQITSLSARGREVLLQQSGDGEHQECWGATPEAGKRLEWRFLGEGACPAASRLGRGGAERRGSEVTLGKSRFKLP